MRLLLDTHVFLWSMTDRRRLGAQLSVIEDPRHELFVSAATSWEIAIKYAMGKLRLPHPPDVYVPNRLRRMGGHPLAVEHSHALAVASLPLLHRDPFDRLLIAQAQALNLAIVTGDRSIAQYPVETLLVEPA